jgi:predicted permease
VTPGSLNEPLVLLVLLALGYGVEKFRLLSIDDIDVIPRILFQISYPALIIVSIDRIDLSLLLKNSILVIVVTLSVTLAVYFLGVLALRRYSNKGRREIILFQMMISNVTFVGLPLIQMFFGEIGIYYAIIFSFSQDLLLWSLCCWFFSCSEYRLQDGLKHILNPCMLSLVIAIVIVGSGVSLPFFLYKPLETLSLTALPLALIFMGSIFNRGTLKQWMPEKDVLLLVGSKVLLLPLAVYGLLTLFSVEEGLVVLLALLFGLPFPLLSAVFAKQYNKDYVFALKGILFSTLISLLLFGLLYIYFAESLSTVFVP